LEGERVRPDENARESVLWQWRKNEKGGKMREV